MLLASPENCCILASVASCVLATSIAASSVSVSSRHNSFSCTFPCRTPTTNCSINLSSVSVASRNLHLRACVLQHVMNSSTVSELNCLNFCRWKRQSVIRLGFYQSLEFSPNNLNVFLFSFTEVPSVVHSQTLLSYP